MVGFLPNNAFLMTDEAMPYRGAKHMFLGHETVNHSEKEYARGIAHVNTAESVHALLKRGVMGVYHHWSKKHLHRYLAEFDFRWNHRKISDGERTMEAIAIVGGKRLRYKDPVKKN
jgi:ISXO2-like transposase domain